MKPLSGALIDYRQKDTLQGQTTYQKISKIEQWVKKSEKGDICLPFCEKKKKLCPCALTLKRQMHQKGQSFINFFRKSSRHTISKGTRIFPKRQKRYQKWSRVARSTPFRSLSGPFLKNPNSSRPAQQENSAILLRISQMSRARGGLEKNP